jgi:LysM repeat protein
MALFLSAIPALAQTGSVPQSSSGITTYLTKPGDTLYSIAWRHGVDVWSLAQINAIHDVALIYAGELLVIPSACPPIRLTSPQPGTSIMSPVTIRGESNTFEGHVAVRILDSRWRVIGVGTGIGGGLGVYAPFSVVVPFTPVHDDWGVVEAWWDRPQDGAEIDTVSVRVHLSGERPTERTYTVRRGDNLYRISLLFGTTVQHLVQANGILDPNLIYINQVLRIP